MVPVGGGVIPTCGGASSVGGGVRAVNDCAKPIECGAVPTWNCINKVDCSEIITGDAAIMFSCDTCCPAHKETYPFSFQYHPTGC